ncbi:hypothetical protein [Hymenobacter psoromatis]|uniref:hypothetical protein n=1 Tax=Hymenobacter psoromatis TaxID=1484116 RepID=UPI001CBA822C|nr:hypothetical protein [Hymenobacter psoromatis]
MKKTLPLLITTLVVSSLAAQAQAQTAPPARRAAARPDTTTAVARHRAKSYTGPKVVKNTQELGQKFRRHSTPADVRPKMKPQPK